MYSLSDKNTLDNDTSLVCSKQSAPVILSEVAAICYPAFIKATTEQNQPVQEPGLVVVDISHNSWRKMVLPV